MDRQEYLASIRDVIYLVRCVINRKIPDRTENMNLEHLYKAADRHMLTAVTAMALESAGIHDDSFTQAKGKAIRKAAVLDIDTNTVFQKFEENGIWYMPLKGAVLKSYYPEYGMRQMSDIDILFDRTYTGKVKEVMEGIGFTTEHFGRGYDDAYFKKPVSNFEMHRQLFLEAHDPKIYHYYSDVKKRLVKDENNNFGYHFTDEDFYIYMTAHEYKHYMGGGTGLRSLLDTYVLLRHFESISCLDMEYIQSECEKLGMADFEEQNRRLALKLFDGKKLSSPEKKMLMYFICSGTYGNTENSVRNEVKKYGGGRRGKRRYLLERLFLSESNMKSAYPFFYRHKLLLPILVLYRIGRALTVSRKLVTAELKTVLKK